MKFIHTADLHLDSPLLGLSAYADAPAERLRTATREAFQNLVGVAVEEQVDFMIIAGDLYDGKWKDYNTGLFFVRQMGRLRAAGIPVFLLYGNHDAESDMTKSLQLPGNVQTFSSRKAETFHLEALKVALHGQSFKEAKTLENLVPDYPPPVSGWLNIGVLHTALEGSAQHANYAPCSRAELRARGYQYWALGHVHEHFIERGETTIAYPGNLQGRHIREAGARGALLVGAEDTQITTLERLEVDVLRWHALEVDISTARHRRAALRLVGQALAGLLDDARHTLPLAVRVSFTGRSVAHEALVGDEGQLRQEVIAQALALDPERLWVEKVRVASSAPDTQRVPEDELGGALRDLEHMALGATGDPEFVQALHKDWNELLDRIPAEVRTLSPELEALRRPSPTDIDTRIRAALPLLMARVNPAATDTD